MGDTTGISWTDATWNPIRGCSRVSEGCRNCYAERVAARFSGSGQPYHGLAVMRDSRPGERGGRPAWTGEVRFVAEHLADPLRWKKPRRIFVNSMSDLFHEKLTNEQIAAVFGVMAAAPQHTFQVLTKRAARMREWFVWAGRMTLDDLHVLAYQAVNGVADARGMVARGTEWPLPNVWLGVSVENQAAADERIPDLLATPAAVRFLSCEPLLGPVEIGHWLDLCHKCHVLDGVTIEERHAASHGKALHWVIAGCESGPGARPCDAAWLRSLRDQCATAGTAFFLKQAIHGAVFTAGPGNGHHGISFGSGSKRKAGGVIELPYLDGVQHAAFPARST